MNPSSPSTRPPQSAEQRGLSSREEISRPRERAPPHSTSHASQQPQPVVPPPGVRQPQILATLGEDADPATVKPHSRMSDRSRAALKKRESTETRSTKTKGKNILRNEAAECIAKGQKMKTMKNSNSTQCTTTTSSSKISSKITGISSQFTRTNCPGQLW